VCVYNSVVGFYAPGDLSIESVVEREGEVSHFKSEFQNLDEASTSRERWINKGAKNISSIPSMQHLPFLYYTQTGK